MGTRADFYVGAGAEAEWLGSIAWDGYEWEEQPECPLLQVRTEAQWREAVNQIKSERNDFTSPEQGWPWPWDNSHLTDYVYAFVGGRCHVFRWGKGAEWPDMSAKQNVALDPKRGGVFILAPKK